MLGEKGLGKVDEVGDHLVCRVRPIAGELKAVAGLFLVPAFVAIRLPDVLATGGVAVILGLNYS